MSVHCRDSTGERKERVHRKVKAQSGCILDENVRQDVTRDPLSVRLNRGPEVYQGTIHKMSAMTHIESLTS